MVLKVDSSGRRLSDVPPGSRSGQLRVGKGSVYNKQQRQQPYDKITVAATKVDSQGR